MNEFKEKETFYSEKGRQFSNECVSFLLFLLSNQEGLVQCSSSACSETFQKICEEKFVMEIIFRNVIRLSISFSSTFLWLLPKIEQKHIPFNDNIVWCKYSRVITDLSKKGNFFLLTAPKYLGARFFIFSTRYLYVFSEMHSSQKKSVKLKRFLCKDKFSQNFLNSLV